VWFNEELSSSNMIVPGLVVLIMMIIAGLLTSLTIAREWERGTMEQLVSTPVKAAELILGKLIPYFAIGMTDVLIATISIANGASAVKLVSDIINTDPFTNNAKTLLASGGAIWLTNVIAFGLWYWDLDRGGAAARAHGAGQPAFVFPEMTNSQYVEADWYPKFVDYLHLSFTTATAFSPTDVSAIRPWAKLLMMAEEAISLVVGLLVIARAVNILK
jgi:hypothetical protein